MAVRDETQLSSLRAEMANNQREATVRIRELEEHLRHDPGPHTYVACAGGCGKGVRHRYAVFVGDKDYCPDCAGELIKQLQANKECSSHRATQYTFTEDDLRG